MLLFLTKQYYSNRLGTVPDLNESAARYKNRDNCDHDDDYDRVPCSYDYLPRMVNNCSAKCFYGQFPCWLYRAERNP